MTAFQNKPASAVLVYDPSATSNELVCAAIREAGYAPLPVAGKMEAAQTALAHGPSGSGTLAALILDASADAPLSEIVLRSILAVPGSEHLLGLLLVDPQHPTPLPSMAALPSLSRPFSRAQLVAVLNETLGDSAPGESAPNPSLEREEPADPSEERDVDLADPPALRCALHQFPLHAALHALDAAHVSGVVSINDGERSSQIVVHEGRILRAEMTGPGGDETHGFGFYLRGGGEEASGDEALTHAEALVRLTSDELDAATVMSAVEAHGLEILRFANTWEHAVLEFCPQRELSAFDEWCASHTSPRAPTLGAAALACMQSAEDLLARRARATEFDQVLVRRDAAVARLRAVLGEEELNVLEHINGQLTLKEVSRKAGYGSFAVAKIVAGLTNAGIVERRAPPTFV